MDGDDYHLRPFLLTADQQRQQFTKHLQMIEARCESQAEYEYEAERLRKIYSKTQKWNPTVQYLLARGKSHYKGYPLIDLMDKPK